MLLRGIKERRTSKTFVSEEESSGNRAKDGLAERLDWRRGAVRSPCRCGRAGRPGGGTGNGRAPAHWEGGREEAGRGGSLRGWAISEQEERKSSPGWLLSGRQSGCLALAEDRRHGRQQVPPGGASVRRERRGNGRKSAKLVLTAGDPSGRQRCRQLWWLHEDGSRRVSSDCGGAAGVQEDSTNRNGCQVPAKCWGGTGAPCGFGGQACRQPHRNTVLKDPGLERLEESQEAGSARKPKMILRKENKMPNSQPPLGRTFKTWPSKQSTVSASPNVLFLD